MSILLGAGVKECISLTSRSIKMRGKETVWQMLVGFGVTPADADGMLDESSSICAYMPVCIA